MWLRHIMVIRHGSLCQPCSFDLTADLMFEKHISPKYAEKSSVDEQNCIKKLCIFFATSLVLCVPIICISNFKRDNQEQNSISKKYNYIEKQIILLYLKSD